MNDTIFLKDLAVGKSGTVTSLRNTGAMRRRMLDIGLTENAVVTCVGRSPAGNPAAYWIRGAVIALRKQDAADVMIIPQNGGGLCATDNTTL